MLNKSFSLPGSVLALSRDGFYSAVLLLESLKLKLLTQDLPKQKYRLLFLKPYWFKRWPSFQFWMLEAKKT